MADPSMQALDAMRTSDLQNASQMMKYQYTGLNIPGLRIQQGSGPRFAEIYPATESMNPNPGVPTIEVMTRQRGKFLYDLLASEALQLRTRQDAQMQALKLVFQRSLIPWQLAASKTNYNINHEPGQSYQHFMEQSGIEEFMRRAMFPRLADDPVNVEKDYTSEQRAIIEYMRQLAQQAP